MKTLILVSLILIYSTFGDLSDPSGTKSITTELTLPGTVSVQ